VAPGLNDAGYPRHGSRIFREAIEFLYQCIDFLLRGKAILKDSISDVFQGDGDQKLDLAMSSYWLNNGHLNLLKAAVREQDRQAWPDIWIAAPSADHFAIEFTVSLKCSGFGIGEMPIEVYVLENDVPAGTQISIKRGDSLGWVVKVRKQEPCINNIEDRANIIIRGSYVEQAELHIANVFCIHFAARDVELRLIDVRADGLAARAYASGQFHGDVTPAAANIQAQLPLADGDAIK
jgi:hypothetical protein